MTYQVGDSVLITTDCFFFAPDGKQYRAVWGKLKGIHDSETVLGVRTNAKSTNWYIEVGDMLVAGCQVHYAIKCDKPNLGASEHDEILDGEVKILNLPSRIYDAS